MRPAPAPGPVTTGRPTDAGAASAPPAGAKSDNSVRSEDKSGTGGDSKKPELKGNENPADLAHDADAAAQKKTDAQKANGDPAKGTSESDKK
jgi:hypothetical protein